VSYLILQSEYYSQLKDIHLAGLVIYVGTDDKARQASGIFGGSFIKDLVNEGQADLKRLIDHATTVIKYFFVIPLIRQADLCPRYKLIDPTASLPLKLQPRNLAQSCVVRMGRQCTIITVV